MNDPINPYKWDQCFLWIIDKKWSCDDASDSIIFGLLDKPTFFKCLTRTLGSLKIDVDEATKNDPLREQHKLNNYAILLYKTRKLGYFLFGLFIIILLIFFVYCLAKKLKFVYIMYLIVRWAYPAILLAIGYVNNIINFSQFTILEYANNLRLYEEKIVDFFPRNDDCKACECESESDL
jgi:hypothetical protein